MLINDDALKVLPTLPNNSVELILSDVPYGIAMTDWDVLHNNKNSALLKSSPAQKGNKLFQTRGKPIVGWSKADRNRGKEFYDFTLRYLLDCYRILKPGGFLVCFTGRQMQHKFITACEDAGFFLKDIITWDKGSAPFRAQRLSEVLKRRGTEYVGNERLGNLAPRTEPIVWCIKGWEPGNTATDIFLEYGTAVFYPDVLKSNLIQCSSRIPGRVHPTEKPLELLEKLVATFSAEGHTILDMFMGSGTTGVAATHLNRKFIGVEIDPKYFAIASGRICGEK